jgi:NadR type nicotinamide-nucleotide adenylyltransferase
MEKAISNIIRIAIVGPESTGKTTLAAQLAKHYNTCFVPEYAREYIDKLKRPYTIDDIITISKSQVDMEDKMALSANKILICDTNLVVTKIWAEHAFAYCPEWILSNIKKRKYALHLLTCPDIPWEADSQREHPHLREQLFEKYRTELDEEKIPYQLISRTGESRTEMAIKIIEALLSQND